MLFNTISWWLIAKAVGCWPGSFNEFYSFGENQALFAGQNPTLAPKLLFSLEFINYKCK
jgi:hypothetical protein